MMRGIPSIFAVGYGILLSQGGLSLGGLETIAGESTQWAGPMYELRVRTKGTTEILLCCNAVKLVLCSYSYGSVMF